MICVYPNKNNFCGGSFKDWLEVYLTDTCNGNCSWCIDKEGFKPKLSVSSDELVKMIEKSKKKNVLLVGGEPTLYKDSNYLISTLVHKQINVYITTNGSTLTELNIIRNNLALCKGVNISLHSYNLDVNKKITGLSLNYNILKDAISLLQNGGASIRFNCNLIKDAIDSKIEIEKYIDFAKGLNVSNVRFAELKNDTSNFVSLYSIYKDQYGINDDPFTKGCNISAKIKDIDINFRLMCGLQNSNASIPKNYKQKQKKVVLYYDGNFYKGWMKKTEIVLELEEAYNELKEMSALKENKELRKRIKELEKSIASVESSYCMY
jgi:MoaA/NifB/PqqE/SkfB family radical SAM enzyme